MSTHDASTRVKDETIISTAAAMAMLVIIDPATDKSRDEYSWYVNVTDARVAAVALVEARGWTLGSRRERFLAGEHEGEMVWDHRHEDGYPDHHVGAVYACTLSDEATITRPMRRTP
jgi:hypothetical protein